MPPGGIRRGWRGCHAPGGGYDAAGGGCDAAGGGYDAAGGGYDAAGGGSEWWWTPRGLGGMPRGLGRIRRGWEGCHAAGCEYSEPWLTEKTIISVAALGRKVPYYKAALV